jgi:hypothetical protein
MVQNGVGTANQIAWSTGGAFTNVTPDALACTGIMRAATFKDTCYIQRAAQQAVVKWTGAAATVLGTSFNDNISAPTGTNMPKAKCIAAHNGYVFIANTNETGTAFPSRVRWSHPNQPADYRTLDFIDVDTGHDGDQITALVPFHDRLLIFKANSVHVLYGFGTDSFAIQPLHQSVGAVSQEAVCVTDYGVYFFSWPEGIMWFDGHEVKWAFERIWPAIQDGRIPASLQANITVQWINRRVWVSVPFGTGATGNNRVFVLDPSLVRKSRYKVSTEGGWTAYGLTLGPMLEWQPPGSASQYLACSVSTNSIVKLHQSTLASDQYNSAGSLVPISSYYFTRWIDAGNPAIDKRWKRPEFTVRRSTAGGQVRVDVYRNYDPATLLRTSFISLAPGTVNPLTWDTGAHNSNMVWDTTTWAADSDNSELVVKGATLGRARAVQLKLSGPTSPITDWTVDSIVFKYIPRRVRA